jgi:hypothetical protein
MNKHVLTGRYAAVTSTLALIVALSGTAYAVNTVRSSDIVDGAVKSIDIGTGAVESIDIKNAAVGTIDVAPASLGRSPRLWARVDGAGNLVAGSGVTSTSRLEEGAYQVMFSRDVSACAVSLEPLNAISGYIGSFTLGGVDVYLATDSDFSLLVVC